MSATAALTETFTVLAREFEVAYPGTRVVFNIAAGPALAQQIVGGKPPDVFAASPAEMKQVTNAGAAQASPKILVRDRLAIAVPPKNPAKVARLADLARPGVKVAMCAAELPCGVAARAALDAAQVKVTPVTLEQNALAALTKVKASSVDAAVVYRTEVKAAGAGLKAVVRPSRRGRPTTIRSWC